MCVAELISSVPYLARAVWLSITLLIGTVVVCGASPTEVTEWGVNQHRIRAHVENFRTEHGYVLRLGEHILIACPSPEINVRLTDASLIQYGRWNLKVCPSHLGLWCQVKKRGRAAVWKVGKPKVVRQSGCNSNPINSLNRISSGSLSAIHQHGPEFPSCNMLWVCIHGYGTSTPLLNEANESTLTSDERISRNVSALLCCSGGISCGFGAIGDGPSLLLNLSEAFVHGGQLTVHRDLLISRDASVPDGSPKGSNGCEKQESLNKNRPSPILPFSVLVTGILLACYSIKSICDLSEGGYFVKAASLIGAGICFACATFLLLQQYVY